MMNDQEEGDGAAEQAWAISGALESSKQASHSTKGSVPPAVTTCSLCRWESLCCGWVQRVCFALLWVQRHGNAQPNRDDEF